MEPIETKALNPTISRGSNPARRSERAALADESDIPGRATVAKVALKPVIGFITPRQLGPIRRILPRMVSLILALVLLALLSHLFEAGGDDDGCGYADSHRVLDRVQARCPME